MFKFWSVLSLRFFPVKHLLRRIEIRVVYPCEDFNMLADAEKLKKLVLWRARCDANALANRLSSLHEEWKDDGPGMQLMDVLEMPNAKARFWEELRAYLD